MRERNHGRTQEQAAAKANLRSRKTVGKYERLGKLPSELRQPRLYRTRPDPFEADWPEVVALLEQAPELEAKTLFEWLGERQPGKYEESQLRTLQRHVSAWRALHGQAVLTLEQVHRPGEVLQTDGTWMNTLGVTLGGQAFAHMLIHSVLPYSNWEWGRVVQSESLLAIRLGLQSALARLGYVPVIHQTDNTTAATHNLGPGARDQRLAERGYNQEYLQLLAHFGMQPRTIHVASPNENGDIEAANRALKQSVEQHLLLRGCRDFADLVEYEAFLWRIMDKRNALRSQRLAEELAVMRPLSMGVLPEPQEVRPRVSAGGTIRVLNNTYSVPSGLKGKIVTVRIYEWQLEVWYANQCVDTLPRLTGLNHHRVNYRHVIDSLLRKPGGLRNYRYREDLFPRAVFRQAWEALNRQFSPRRADLAYLRILKLAAYGSESDVAAVLESLLTTQTAWDDQSVAALLQPVSPDAPVLQPVKVNLAEYDRLLGGEVNYGAA
jgi:transposase InsO family protein